MVDAEALVLRVEDSKVTCKLYVIRLHPHLLTLTHALLPTLTYTPFHFLYYTFTFTIIPTFANIYINFFYSPNDEIITATTKPRTVVKIGDVVTFSVVPNKEIWRRSLHKIECVRHDLTWEDVMNNM